MVNVKTFMSALTWAEREIDSVVANGGNGAPERLARAQSIVNDLRQIIREGHLQVGKGSTASSSSPSASSSISLDREAADLLRSHLKESLRLLRHHGDLFPSLQRELATALEHWPRVQDLRSPSGTREAAKTPQAGQSSSEYRR